jgi:hypothetical protein
MAAREDEMNRQPDRSLLFTKINEVRLFTNKLTLRMRAHREDPNAKIAAPSKHLRTSDGKFVQWRGKGVYEILDTGEILTWK